MKTYETIKDKYYFENFKGIILKYDPEQNVYTHDCKHISPIVSELNNDNISLDLSRIIYRETKGEYDALLVDLHLFLPYEGDTFHIVSFPNTNLCFVKVTMAQFLFGVYLD